MNYEIRIDRLVLEGLDVASRDGKLIQAAVAAELTRLVTEGGLSPALQSGGAIPSLGGGIVEATPGGPPTVLGQRIARAVYGGLGP
jgi:hypothetical protein